MLCHWHKAASRNWLCWRSYIKSLCCRLRSKVRVGLDWKNWVSKVDRDVRHCCKRNATQPCGQLSDRRSCNAGQFATICGNRHSCRQNISTTYRLIYLSLYILTIFHSTQGTNPMDTLKQRWQVLPAGQTVHKSAFALAKTIIAEEGNVNSCRTLKHFVFVLFLGWKSIIIISTSVCWPL